MKPPSSMHIPFRFRVIGFKREFSVNAGTAEMVSGARDRVTMKIKERKGLVWFLKILSIIGIIDGVET